MTNYRTKTISLTLAVALSLGSLSACASTTAASTASIAVPADPVEATVTVTALSLDGATVKLPDGTEFTIPADELPDINDLSLGDEITIEYTQNADGSYSAVVTEEEAPADETEDESESASESEPTTESEPVSEEEAKAEEKTADESSKQAQSAPTQSSTSAAASTTSTSTATSKASESAAVSKTSTSSSKQKPELYFKGTTVTVNDWETPAVKGSYLMDTWFFDDADYNELGKADMSKVSDSSKESSGYNKYGEKHLSIVKAFNDYRGVDTPYVVVNNGSYYLYDASTDSFTLKQGTPPDVATSTTASDTNSDPFGDIVLTPNVPDSESKGDVYKAIELINEERAKEGLDELEIDDELMELADVRATEIKENFSHTRPDGTRCAITHHCWENIASGYPTAESVVRAWMKSQGHKDNILEEQTTRIGVGCCDNFYWVMLASD